MKFSHWARTIIGEKHHTAMRWVTTTLAETDSKVALERLLDNDVLPAQVGAILAFELRGNSAPDTNIAALHLSLDQISRHLLAAYEKTYAYLVAPEVFLADLLASIEGVAFDDTFEHKLKVFITYDYFPVILSAWSRSLRDHGTGFVSRTELVVKLHEIDELIMRHATISVMVDLLDPLYEFHRHRSSDPKLPGSELAIFFDDKNFTRAVQEFSAQAEREFSLREAVELISVLLGTGYSVADVPAAIEVPERVEYPETQYDEFLQDLQQAGVRVQTPEEPEVKPLPSVELFISKKLRERAIRDVFHGNRGEYVRFLSFLNASNTLDKALLNLDTTLRMQRVDPKSKVAQRLRDATVLRFHQIRT